MHGYTRIELQKREKSTRRVFVRGIIPIRATSCFSRKVTSYHSRVSPSPHPDTNCRYNYYNIQVVMVTAAPQISVNSCFGCRRWKEEEEEEEMMRSRLPCATCCAPWKTSLTTKQFAKLLISQRLFKLQPRWKVTGKNISLLLHPALS